MTIPGTALPPIRAVPGPLAGIFIGTHQLKIVYIQREVWMSLSVAERSFPLLDFLEMNC